MAYILTIKDEKLFLIDSDHKHHPIKSTDDFHKLVASFGDPPVFVSSTLDFADQYTSDEEVIAIITALR